ncbi:MAG: VPS10 domain-containing protein [Bacteroidia bacterium]
MRNVYFLGAMLLFFVGFTTFRQMMIEKQENEGAKLQEPADWSFLQRSYPDFKGADAAKAYDQAVQMAVWQRNTQRTAGTTGWNADWTLEGPNNTGGRFNTVAIHPTTPNIMYAGAASGGVWKTTDGGTTWNPIFDDKPYLSVSHIVFDPTNPNTIFVGTGDTQISGYPFLGDGIYKSTDAGATWTNIGLAQCKIISRIAINPQNPNIIYAATMGLPFERGLDRGLYKTTNGGGTWTKVLYVSDQAGVVDLLLDPTNANTIYATSWDRIRNMQESTVSGSGGRIWKSTDGGTTWNQIMNGITGGDLCRIGIAISQQNNNKLYAVVVNTGLDLENVYKTTNGGTTWTAVQGNNLDFSGLGGFGWYFGQIRVNPTNDNHIWVLGVGVQKSTDGGNNWTDGDGNGDMHSDKHDLEFINGSQMIMATDGGIYKSVNSGSSWTDIEKIPVNQIYRIGIDPNEVENYTIGVQDNGTNEGNQANINTWTRVWWGDGFQARYDEDLPGTYYAMSQNLSIYFIDTTNSVYSDHTTGIDPSDRRGWDAPFTFSPASAKRQYTGTYRVYRNVDGETANWQPISDDLSDGLVYFSRAHIITWVEESPLNQQVIWATTADANVQVTTNDGATWAKVDAALPEFFVTSIHPSHKSMGGAYVTFSGYRYNDNTPHIYKTTNYGQTWTAIAGNLPMFSINDVLVYPTDENIMFVATDGGVYGTVDGGISWNRVGGNMPIVAVYDIEFDATGKKLLAGTYARSLHSFDMDEILSVVSLTPALPTISVTAYPNPTTDVVTIKTDNKIAVEIYNVQGQIVAKGMSNEAISIQQLSAGLYVVRGKDAEHYYQSKFVKQ